MLIIDGYRIDAELRCDVSRRNAVTKWPVEKGADTTDHVRAEPVTLTIEGIVSDTPLTEMSAVRSQFTIINGEAFAKPSHEARARLHEIDRTKEPITVECSEGVFRNMVLESLDGSRDPDTGDCYRFTATFSEMELVTNDRTTIKTAQPRAQKKVNLGHRAMVDAVRSGFGFRSVDLSVSAEDQFTSETKQLHAQSGIANRRPRILN